MWSLCLTRSVKRQSVQRASTGTEIHIWKKIIKKKVYQVVNSLRTAMEFKWTSIIRRASADIYLPLNVKRLFPYFFLQEKEGIRIFQCTKIRFRSVNSNIKPFPCRTVHVVYCNERDKGIIYKKHFGEISNNKTDKVY